MIKFYDETKKDELLSYQGKWKVLYISTIGSFFGNGDYNSEEEAQDAIDNQQEEMDLKIMVEKGKQFQLFVGSRLLYLYPAQHLCAFPMPVGEQ